MSGQSVNHCELLFEFTTSKQCSWTQISQDPARGINVFFCAFYPSGCLAKRVRGRREEANASDARGRGKWVEFSRAYMTRARASVDRAHARVAVLELSTAAGESSESSGSSGLQKILNEM